MRPKVLITNWVHPPVLARLAGIADVVANETSTPWPRAEVRQRATSFDAMLAFMPDHVDAAFLAACPRLKMIACALKGFDNFDIAAVKAHGAQISIVSDLLTEPTAELAVGLAIGLGRKLRAGDAHVRSGAFDGWRPILYGTGLAGATVAIIGLGAVGTAIAERLSGFGCRLVGVDPHNKPGSDIPLLPLADALAQADYVILAAPLTPTSHHLINAETLAWFKPGALLINVGRGSVVDELAIAQALIEDRLGGYAADVFEFEDWALAGRPSSITPELLTHPQTLFTPHLGSAVDQVRLATAMRAAENIIDWIEGRTPRDALVAAH